MNPLEKPSVISLIQGNNLIRSLIRFYIFSTAITCLSFLFGIAFCFIVWGITVCVIRLAPIWEPAYKLIAKIAGARDIDKDFKPLKPHWWQLFPWVLHIGVGLFLIGFGLWLLFHNGLYQQNLIYLMLKSK